MKAIHDDTGRDGQRCEAALVGSPTGGLMCPKCKMSPDSQSIAFVSEYDPKSASDAENLHDALCLIRSLKIREMPGFTDYSDSEAGRWVPPCLVIEAGPHWGIYAEVTHFRAIKDLL